MNTTFKDENLYKILLGSHLSEKSTRLAEVGQYVFKVVAPADKALVKRAVEKLFNVKVASVRILNTNAKVRRFGHSVGKRKAWKKAYVHLEEGQKIELAGAGG